MTMKRITSAKFTPIVAALLLGTALSARADDTEVYLDSGRAVNAPPVIMFYMEYDPNLNSAASDNSDPSNPINPCNSLLPDGSDLATECPGFAALEHYFVHATDPGASADNNDFADGTISQFEVIRAAMKRALISLGDIKVGLMLTHNDATGCAGPQPASTRCSNGAYVLKHAVQLANVPTILQNNAITSFDARNPVHISTILTADSAKAALFQKLNAIVPAQGNVAHPNQMKEVYFELFRYLTGQDVYNGFNGWDDFASVNNRNLGQSSDTFQFSNAAGAPTFNTQYLGWDEAALDSDTSYRSPLTQHCQKVFMVNLVYGGSARDNNSDTAIEAGFPQGMSMAVSNDYSGLVEMVFNLRDYDLASSTLGPSNLVDRQNVTSFFVAGNINNYNAAAAAGGTGAALQLTFNPDKLVNSLQNVLNQILSVSTTFVAASIPVNVFNRSEVIDNAYIALFQANEAGKPAWVGDVKKLKLRIGTDAATGKNKLEFIDAQTTPQVAISATDGRILPTALTYWTNKDGYDIDDVPSPSVTGQDPEPVNDADGRAVMRGGSGQKIPGFLVANGTTRGTASWINSATGARRLYTEYWPTTSIPANRLMDIQWSNIAYLWYFIRGMNDTAYSTTLWQPITNATGTAVTYSGAWTIDQINSISPATDCYTFSTSSATVAASTLAALPTNGCKVKDLASNVLAFMRGYDVNATAAVANQIPALRLNTRRWIMGDPLHSRPLPINYGLRTGYTATNPDIRIIVGSNDGYLRMLKNTGSDGSEIGQEVWAFMPLELMKIQKQLMDNEIVGSTSTRPRHPYGVDGTPVGYIRDGDGTIGTCTEPGAASPCDDQVLIFFGLRRGGRAYYSMDITNPDSPTLKWKITNLSITTSSNTNASSTDFAELGYTFSQPVVRHMNWGAGVTPVLIFGGGYDTNKDLQSLGTNDTMGRAIYIVNANDGTLVWKATGGVNDTTTVTPSNTVYFNADMDDSIPSEVTAADSNGDGLVDRVYVGDTGGRVWRVDMPGQTTAGTTDPRNDWTASMLMNVGRHNTNDRDNDRRFFNAPDVVPTKDTTNFDAIVIGSGNRENPLGTATSDYLFVYKDRAISGLLPDTFTTVTPTNLFDLTNNCIQMNTCSTLTTSEATQFSTGWKIDLTDSGEKALAAATTLRGVVYFSTYVPATAITVVSDDPATPEDESETASCKPEGKGYFYAISLANAGSMYNFSTRNETSGTALNTADRKREMVSGGIPSENVYVSFRQGDETYTGILPSDLNATDDLGSQQWRTFWYEKNR
jgi:type IV pilus assembly protein PilY1